MLKTNYKYKIFKLQHFTVTSHTSVFQHTNTQLSDAINIFFYYVHRFLNIHMYF